jgi:transposase
LSEKPKYRQFTSEQRVEIVLAGLRGDRSVRDGRREYEVSEALFYQWRDRLLEGGKTALATARSAGRSPEAPSTTPAAESISSSRACRRRSSTKASSAFSARMRSFLVGLPGRSSSRRLAPSCLLAGLVATSPPGGATSVVRQAPRALLAARGGRCVRHGFPRAKRRFPTSDRCVERWEKCLPPCHAVFPRPSLPAFPQVRGLFRWAPPVGFEPTLPPPEGGALSPELRGPARSPVGPAGPARTGRRHHTGVAAGA